MKNYKNIRIKMPEETLGKKTGAIIFAVSLYW
jgi:hypothetical protein